MLVTRTPRRRPRGDPPRQGRGSGTAARPGRCVAVVGPSYQPPGSFWPARARRRSSRTSRSIPPGRILGPSNVRCAVGEARQGRPHERQVGSFLGQPSPRRVDQDDEGRPRPGPRRSTSGLTPPLRTSRASAPSDFHRLDPALECPPGACPLRFAPLQWPPVDLYLAPDGSARR